MKKIAVCGIFVLIACPLILFALYYHFNAPRDDFPVDTPIQIPDGATQSEIGHILQDNHIIQSSIVFKLYVSNYFKGRPMQAGVYTFPYPLPSSDVAQALVEGTNMTPNITLTLPEGFSVRDIATYIPNGYQQRISSSEYIQFEGYLFPDTYYISNMMSMDQVIEMLRNRMNDVLTQYAEQISASGMSEYQVLTFASILEREANDEDSMRRVSGILHNRLNADMPLQVDATLDYLLNKRSDELTQDDLNIDSPYNTYRNRGLPPTPIANPGLRAIDATLNPIESDNYFYLTGKDGNFYYAKTFEEHVKNKEKYLR